MELLSGASWRSFSETFVRGILCLWFGIPSGEDLFSVFRLAVLPILIPSLWWAASTNRGADSVMLKKSSNSSVNSSPKISSGDLVSGRKPAAGCCCCRRLLLVDILSIMLFFPDTLNTALYPATLSARCGISGTWSLSEMASSTERSSRKASWPQWKRHDIQMSRRPRDCMVGTGQWRLAVRRWGHLYTLRRVCRLLQLLLDLSIVFFWRNTLTQEHRLRACIQRRDAVKKGQAMTSPG